MTNHHINNKTKKRIREIKGDRCEDCGKENGPVDNPNERLQIHHRKPRWKGGPNRISNLRLLCKECHDKAHREYHKQKLKYIKKLYEELVGSRQYGKC